MKGYLAGGLEQNRRVRERAYLRKRGAEHLADAIGFTSAWITENNTVTSISESDDLLGKILYPDNLLQACRRVIRNKGSHGVDGLSVESLGDYLKYHGSELIRSIQRGIFKPNPVRRVEIPKDHHSTRALGIPTVVDRVIQQAIHQVLSPIYEQQFSDHSFGFRPNRSTHGALFRCKQYLTEGYRFAVDMDMAKFFDTVSHSKLIEVLSRTVKDGRVVSLIHKYLNAGVVVDHKFESTKQGVPQGGPLSPLLSNIMLNELDKELSSRGHRYVRYADDVVILCRSKRAAHRVMGSITRFIERRLYLRVNKEKTEVVPFTRIKFLGYSFYKTKTEIRFRAHSKSIAKMKLKLKELTNRSSGQGNAARKRRLSYFIKGWLNYFRYADMQKVLRRTDEWFRRRLRMVIWKQWKRVQTRCKNLRRLGIERSQAWSFANTRKSYWRTAKSPILQRSITSARLKQAGYIFLSEYYKTLRCD